jgi:N6-L-threonylcarbamoyladenine synthase
MGTTVDDSIGEAFDKVARMLGLETMPSGGPALEAFAKHGDPHAVPLTMPLRTKRTCDFSYSGLKTAVLVALEDRALGTPTPENFQVQCCPLFFRMFKQSSCLKRCEERREGPCMNLTV